MAAPGLWLIYVHFTCTARHVRVPGRVFPHYDQDMLHGVIKRLCRTTVCTCRASTDEAVTNMLGFGAEARGIKNKATISKKLRAQRALLASYATLSETDPPSPLPPLVECGHALALAPVGLSAPWLARRPAKHSVEAVAVSSCRCVLTAMACMRSPTLEPCIEGTTRRWASRSSLTTAATAATTRSRQASTGTHRGRTVPVATALRPCSPVSA